MRGRDNKQRKPQRQKTQQQNPQKDRAAIAKFLATLAACAGAQTETQADECKQQH